jgi:DNA polymerase-3 subunit delta
MSKGKDLWPEIAQGQPGPLYGIFGPEDFLRRELLDLFIQAPVFAQNPQLNQQHFQAGEVSPGKVADSANTLPFLASRRLLLVHDIDAYKVEELNQFLTYLDNPCPSTCLVFSAARLDARSRFSQALRKKGKVIMVPEKLSARELPSWLAGRAQLRGKELSPAAAALLSNLGNMSLLELDQEVEKLSLFVGSGREITDKEVEALLSQGRIYSVFELGNAITNGDLSRSLNALYQLLDINNEAPLYILAIIGSTVRQWGQALEAVESGEGQSRLQQILHTPPLVTKALLNRARRLSRARLKFCLEMVLETDIALQSSSAAGARVLENLLFHLCAGE